MLDARPGASVLLGASPGAGVRRPDCDYSDEASPLGVSHFVPLAERALPLG